MTEATLAALYPRAARLLYGRPWAVTEETMAILVELADLRGSGLRLTEPQIRERIEARPRGPREGNRRRGTVGVIPVYGVLSHRAGMMANSSGGTSVEGVREAFRSALADPEIDAILFDFDSPGGSVDGIPEFASEIRDARGGAKPIWAIANTSAYSAAYWLASQADQVYVTPSGGVGSIGVLAVHKDESAKLEREGVRTTMIRAGKFKGEGASFEPLGDEARAAIQDDVDAYFGEFEDAIAKGRQVPIAQVRGEAFGQGRTVRAKKAAAAGMVDGVATFDEVVARLSRGGNSARLGGAGTAAIAPTDHALHRSAITREGEPTADGWRTLDIVGEASVVVELDADAADAEIIAEVLSARLEEVIGAEDALAGLVIRTAIGENGAGGSDPDPVAGDPEAVRAALAALPTLERLALVAAQAEDLTRWATDRVAYRARDGRGIARTTRAGLTRLLALRPALDALHLALAESEGLTPDPEAQDPAERVAVSLPMLDLAIAAYGSGFPADEYLEGVPR